MINTPKDTIQVHYQSATGNTKALIERIQGHLQTFFSEYESILPANGKKHPLNLIGVPVYAGRVPNLMLPWLKRLEGNGAYAVALVTFGGRHYDDSLIELTDILTEQGFKVIGAGAFVANHSFDQGLFSERPNAQDLEEEVAFARAIAESLQMSAPAPLAALAQGIGKRPYAPYLVPRDIDGKPIDFKKIKPSVDLHRCTQCGLCVPACPQGSIPLDHPETTPGRCTKCNACVRICPEHARMFLDLGYIWHLNELRQLPPTGAINFWTTGLQLIPLDMPVALATYKHFIKALYADDGNYIDYVTPTLEEIYKRKSAFSRKCKVQGYWITAPSQKKSLGVVTFLVHESYPHTLQIAFFEFYNRLDIPKYVIQAAITYAQANGLSHITLGLCGHVNYGLGLSLENNHRPSFGAPYTKDYYTKYLDHCQLTLNTLSSKSLKTYAYDWSQEGFPLPEAFTKRLNHTRLSHLTWRSAKVHLTAFSRKDIGIYTQLNNACFTKHDFYFKREAQEDYELFKSLKYFMVPGSLIFAYDNDKPVGFLLWYPDWSELMSPHETLGLNTFIKTKMHRKIPSTFKIVEWAVLPEYAKKGIPILLLKACEAIIAPYQFKRMVTSWILDENYNSNTFANHWAQPDSNYKVYRIDVLQTLIDRGDMDGF